MSYFSLIPYRKLNKILIFAVLIIIFIKCVIVFTSSRDNKIKYTIFNIKSPTVTKIIDLNFNFYLNNSEAKDVNYNVHIFYYAWYGNPEVDKKWIHWNHRRLPHWNKGLINDYPQNKHEPPEDIGADFYPALGLYSSRNRSIIDLHLKMIQYTGIGVVVLSWYTNNRSDPNGIPMDDLVPDFLDMAHKFGLKVALHLEPYERRSALSLQKDLLYIFQKYANHSAFFRKPRFKGNKPLPVVFIYDSYLIPADEWIQIFGPKRRQTIRGKQEDFYVVGLLLEHDSCRLISESGFDAGYTYFAGEQFSYSSTSTHWTDINRKCLLRNIEFYPTIGPGYKDSSVRPWNDFVTRNREHGEFYSLRFNRSLNSGARSFGVTSFNEWHEGTQIEPAVPHNNPANRMIYEDYSPDSPMFYLELTRKFVNRFSSLHIPMG